MRCVRCCMWEAMAVPVPYILSFVITVCLFNSVTVVSQQRLRYDIAEELPVGTHIGNIFADSRLNTMYSSSVLGILRLGFLSNDKGHVDFFSLAQSEGSFRIAKKIDRETLCSRQKSCILKVDITVRPLQYFQILKVSVSIADINDNWPQFPQTKLTISIPESQGTGIVALIPLASDKDIGLNDIQKYELRPTSSPFKLEDNGFNNGEQKRLVLSGHLDREKSALHQLKVLAHDGGSPRKSGTFVIEIIVMDINDNVPVFQNKTLTVTLPENGKINSKVAHVIATDRDSGMNGQIRYSFSTDTRNEMGQLFTIDATSGAIFLRRNINRQSKRFYTLSVVATDMGIEQLSSRSSVTIKILNTNKNAPEIKIHDLSGSGSVSLGENVPLHTTAAHVSISDKDTGDSGRLQCSVNDTNFELEHVLETEYKVITRARYDRETKDKYYVLIVCHDFASPKQYSSKKVTVLISDENDNPPFCANQINEAAIEENSGIGISVVRVHCEDKDAGVNGEVVYSLRNSENPKLNIHPSTGVVTTLKVFDREEERKVEAVVYATDRGNPPLTATVSVILDIIDVNDEKPKFTQGSYVFYVLDKTAPAVNVGRVHVNDADSNPYNAVRFIKLATDLLSTSANSFRVEKSTGEIYTTAMLVRKYQISYNFIVEAKNIEPPWHSSTANVTIVVLSEEASPAAVKGSAVGGLSRNMIIIFVLAGALCLMVVITVIISVICCKQKRRDRLLRVPVSNSFLHIAPREHGAVDFIRPVADVNAPVKDWESMSGVLNPPRYATVDKCDQHWEERVPLGSTTSDPESTEYENDGSGQDSVPRSVSSRKDSAPRSHKEASLPRANPPAPKPSVAPRSNPRPIQLPYMQGRPV